MTNLNDQLFKIKTDLKEDLWNDSCLTTNAFEWRNGLQEIRVIIHTAEYESANKA